MIVRVKKQLVSKVIMIDKHKVLLLKRASKSVTDRSPWVWDLPGGHIDEGENPVAAGRREVVEETDLIVGRLNFLGTDSNIGKKTYFYSTEQWDGNIKLSHEHEDYRWVVAEDVSKYQYAVGSMYYKMIMKALKTR